MYRTNYHVPTTLWSPGSLILYSTAFVAKSHTALVFILYLNIALCCLFLPVKEFLMIMVLKLQNSKVEQLGPFQSSLNCKGSNLVNVLKALRLFAFWNWMWQHIHFGGGKIWEKVVFPPDSKRFYNQIWK